MNISRMAIYMDVERSTLSRWLNDPDIPEEAEQKIIEACKQIKASRRIK